MTWRERTGLRLPARAALATAAASLLALFLPATALFWLYLAKMRLPETWLSRPLDKPAGPERYILVAPDSAARMIFSPGTRRSQARQSSNPGSPHITTSSSTTTNVGRTSPISAEAS